jgi:hypothetical protein
MKHIQLIIMLIMLVSCAGSFKSTVKPGYDLPSGNEIAMTYLDHPDISISNKATEVLENELIKCNKRNFIKAKNVEEILQNNNITMPKRLTPLFFSKIKDHIKAKYFLTGGISIWKKGSVGFPVASSTEVSASFTMYDIQSGEVVWTVSGQEEGSSGLFAQAPESKAETVFKTMLKKWVNFCGKKQ